MRLAAVLSIAFITVSQCIQIRVNKQLPPGSTSSKPIVIRAGKITVNAPKATPLPAVESTALKVLVILSKNDDFTTQIIRKTAHILADAAYRVTLLSTFVAHPPQSLVNGVRTKEVDYGAKSEALINSWNEFQVLARIRTVSNFSREMLTFCEKVFDRMDVIDWMRNEKFYIVITCGATCFQPLFRMAGIENENPCSAGPHRIFTWQPHSGRKTIILTTSEPAQWIVRTMGIPESENPTIREMPYFQRAKTVISRHIEDRLLQHNLIRPLNDLGQRMVGERFTSFEEAVAQSSFLLVNSDELADFPRAVTSQWVYIGGMDVRKPSKLNAQWNTLLTTRARSVLVSFADISSGCKRQKETLLQAFLEIPDTTFIWHDATKTALNQTNVVYVNELTESDLLSDSRVTSTITDGRMSQLYNIMSGGKPVVCIPSNFEQQGNCDRLQQQGMAVLISCNVLTTKNVKKMIREAATPKIRDSSNLLAEALKSKLTSRKEKLARTVEFAAKHGVTPRPNSSGTDQNLLQYYHLDVFIPLLLLFVALTLLFAWIICTILSRRSKRQQQNPSSIDENKEDLADQPESATDEHSQSAPKKPAETSELDRE